MAKEEKNELAEVDQNTDLALPSHIELIPEGTPNVPVGLENEGAFESPIFTKVIQQMTGAPFKPPFSDGDYVTADGKLICPAGEWFTAVPIYEYNEYCIHNPRQVPGLPWIREKTFDPTSDLAKRAISANKEVNRMPCPENDKYECLFVKHSNYVLVLLDHNENVGDVPIIHSFHRGEAPAGNSLRRLIKARRTKKMFMNIFGFQVMPRHKNDNDWFGLDGFNRDIENPEDKFVTAEQMEFFQTLYEGAAKQFESMGIVVDYESTTDTVEGEVVSEASDKF